MAVGDPSDGAVGQILLRDAQLGGFAPQTGVGGESAGGGDDIIESLLDIELSRGQPKLGDGVTPIPGDPNTAAAATGTVASRSARPVTSEP